MTATQLLLRRLRWLLPFLLDQCRAPALKELKSEAKRKSKRPNFNAPFSSLSVFGTQRALFLSFCPLFRRARGRKTLLLLLSLCCCRRHCDRRESLKSFSSSKKTMLAAALAAAARSQRVAATAAVGSSVVKQALQAQQRRWLNIHEYQVGEKSEREKWREKREKGKRSHRSIRGVVQFFFDLDLSFFFVSLSPTSTHSRFSA